ncbi:MAG: HAD family hydrolase [Emergencia sp.]
MKDNSRIRMVALDLDGTTLDSSKRISQRTVEAFRRATEKGVHIVVSTGRTFHSLPEQLFQIEGLEYVITSNGAHITDLTSMETIYSDYIGPEAVDAVISAVRGHGLYVETFTEGRAYIDRSEFDEIRGSGSDFRDADYVLSTRNPVPDILRFMEENRSRIENISINFRHLEEKKRWAEILSRIPGITLTSSFAHNFEIGGSSTSKGQALCVLMERLGLNASQLMACGDSLNDGRMLQLAGIGVAVANACDEIKAMADYVTASNDDDGVARAIERFVLNE